MQLKISEKMHTSKVCQYITNINVFLVYTYPKYNRQYTEPCGTSYSAHQKHIKSKKTKIISNLLVRNCLIDLYLPIFISKNMGEMVVILEMENVVNRYNSLKDFVINFDKIHKTEWCYPHCSNKRIGLQRH